MTHAKNLASDVQRIIDDYLDAIGVALQKSRLTREERQSVVDNVEDQIAEMLNARAIATPAEADVRAVLAELDSPESYAETIESTAPEQTLASHAQPNAGERRLSKVAVVGAVWAIAFFTCVPLFFVAWTVTPGNEPSLLWFYTGRALMIAGVSAPLGTTLLGLIAIGQIRNFQGTHYGMGLAIADTLLFPLLAALPVCVAAGGTVIAAINGSSPGWYELMTSPTALTAGFLFWLLIATAVVWLVQRWSRKLPGAS
ncbi:MAG: hypothetical protein SGI88_03120 [Candidatus Hydrogenedentes bacterium]|nr:hypothetical protein [Candidatus Hydrogenedentota bacterium]